MGLSAVDRTAIASAQIDGCLEHAGGSGPGDAGPGVPGVLVSVIMFLLVITEDRPGQGGCRVTWDRGESRPRTWRSPSLPRDQGEFSVRGGPGAHDREEFPVRARVPGDLPAFAGSLFTPGRPFSAIHWKLSPE